MADTINYTNPLTSILPAILGGSSQTDIDKDEDSTTTGTNTTTGTTTQGTTGTNVTKTTADISALEDIYKRQAAGVTPDMLAAIFSEGAKKVPGLQTAYGNAVGARASENTPLATSLRDLQGTLTNQAATLNMQMLKDAGLTAGQIADLTKTVTGTGTQKTTGTNASTVNTNQTTNTNTDINQDTTNTVNPDMVKLLGGLGIGGSVLNSVLPGGIDGILKSITGGTAGNDMLGLLGKIPGMAGLLQQLGLGNNIDLTGMTTDLFNPANLDTWLADNGINWGGNFSDITGGTDFNFDLDKVNFDDLNLGSDFDLGNVDWSGGDLGDWLDWGFADGGTVPASGSSGASSNITLTPEHKTKIAAIEKLFNDPRGNKLLALQAMQNKQKYEGRSADDWREDAREYFKKNKIEHGNVIDMAFGGDKAGVEQWGDALESYVKSLPPGAAKVYAKTIEKDMRPNRYINFLNKAMPMIPGLVAGLGAGGALGILSPGMSSAAGFGAAGSSGGFAGAAGGNLGNAILRQILSKGIGAGIGGLQGSGISGPGISATSGSSTAPTASAQYFTPSDVSAADGGHIRRPGDPIVGTKGPVRTGSGSGGLSDEALQEAMKQMQPARSPTTPSSTARGNGLSFQTNKMLKEMDNYAEGGMVNATPREEMEDPNGIEDLITAQLSPGEYVIPADVVDTLGTSFFDHLNDKYHTPAAMQEAMGLGTRRPTL